MHTVISELKLNSLVGSCEQNAVLGELDGVENPCCRQEDLMHLRTCYGVVNSPLCFGLQRRDEEVKTKVEELKCNRFVLVFRLVLTKTRLQFAFYLAKMIYIKKNPTKQKSHTKKSQTPSTLQKQI